VCLFKGACHKLHITVSGVCACSELHWQIPFWVGNNQWWWCFLVDHGERDWYVQNDPCIYGSSVWTLICHCSRRPLQYFATMYAQFTWLFCNFLSAGLLCDILRSWTGGSLKEPSLDCREDGEALPSQTFRFSLISGMQCDGVHYHVEGWYVSSRVLVTNCT
jgi:hypothetical protein